MSSRPLDQPSTYNTKLRAQYEERRRVLFVRAHAPQLLAGLLVGFEDRDAATINQAAERAVSAANALFRALPKDPDDDDTAEAQAQPNNPDDNDAAAEVGHA